MKRFRNRLCLLGVLPAALAFAPTAAAQDDDEEIIELSPFEVTGADDVGYKASSTLAGTRLKTNLRDIGSAISIVNEELLRDTGANNLEDVLVLTPNTEVAGLSGNFSATQYAGTGNFIPEGHRDNPSGGFTRVRGLDNADLTRNYFLTDVPFDSYNTDRIAVQRGANSALFGLGSPAGIVNATTVRANFGGNKGRFRFETDQYGTTRSSVRYNVEAIEDRLALFVAGLYDNTLFEQEEAFSDDKRIYLSAVGKITDNIRARVSVESGERVSARPDFVPPNDGITPWLLAGKPTVNNPLEGAQLFRGTGDFFPATASNSTNSRLLSVDAAGASSGLVHFFYDVNDPNPTFSGTPFVRSGQGTPGDTEYMLIRVRPMIRTMKLTGGFYPGGETVDPGIAPLFSRGFVDRQILDRSIYDYREHLFSGGTSQQGADFRVLEASLEGSWFEDRVGLEFAYADQNMDTWGFNALQGIEQRTIYIDMNRSLMQQDAAGNWLPNPNFGNPTMGGGYGGNWLKSYREAIRATGFVELRAADFMNEDDLITRILGRLRVTGVMSKNTIEGEENYGGRGGIDPQTTADALYGGDIFGEISATFANYYKGMQYSLPYNSSVDFVSATSLGDVRGANIGGVPFGQSRDRPPNPSTYVGWSTVSDSFVSFTTPVYTLRDNNQFLTSFFSGKSKQEIESQVLVGQYHIWDETIVLTGTWRNDETKAGSVGAPRWEPYGDGRVLSQTEDTFNPAYLAGVTDLSPQSDEDTTSWGIMIHTPQFIREYLPAATEVSFFKSTGNNFQPTGNNVTVLNQSVPPISGTTEDIGFNISTLNGRLNARVTWYETSQQYRRIENSAVNSYAGILVALAQQLDNPTNVGNGYTVADVQAVQPPQGVIGVSGFTVDWANPTTTASENRTSGDTGTQDLAAEGMEIEISYNPTPNWTLLLTVAQQETVTSNSYPVVRRLVEDFVIPQWVNTSFAQNYVLDDLGTTLAERARDSIVVPLEKALLADGNPVIEQREWRVNLNTSYNFGRNSDILPDWVGDLTVGGGIRWQDEIGLSFGASINEFGDWALDRDKPFYGPSQTFVDVFARSTWELNEDHDLTVQVNIKDLTNHDELVPFYTNPDGQSVYRFLEGRLITVSGTITF